MANKLDERPQAENESDSLNPGQQSFDDITRQLRDVEQKGDDIKDHENNRSLYTDAHGDKVQSNYNVDEPESNRDNLKDKEESGSAPSVYKSGGESVSRFGRLAAKFGGMGKNMGPTGGIVGLIMLGLVGIGGGTGIMGSTLLVNIKEIFHNDRADGTRTNQIFSRAIIAHKIGYKNIEGCGKIAIKCRMATMSDSERKRYERAGFKIEGRVVSANGKPTGDKYSSDGGEESKKVKPSDRIIAEKITFPDGTSVNSGSSFFEHTKAKVSMRAASLKAFNPRSDFFRNTRFTNILKKSFGFVKGRTLSGKTKAEIDDDFNKKTGGSTKEELNARANGEKTGKETELEKKAGGVKGKISSMGNIASSAFSGACTAYNTARYGIAAIKMARLYELVAFALPWLQAADQIKDQGKISPEVVDNLSSRLTSYETDKTSPKYGLTATDSQGYKIAAYGDRSALKDFAKKWLLGGDSASVVASVENVLDRIQTLDNKVDKTTGKAGIRYVCKVLNSGTAAVIGIVASGINCASSIFGNAATGPAGCAAMLGWAAAGVALDLAIRELGQTIIEHAIKESSILSLGSDLNGVDAGNAIAAGTGLMLGSASTASGLRPATSTGEIQSYISYTNDSNSQYIAAEQYNSRDDPFNIYDQYSFLGSIVNMLNVTTSSRAPLFSTLANITSTVFSALSGYTTANALYSQPALTPTERYNCQDEDLKDIGIDAGDKFCSVSTIMPTSDLQAADSVINGKGSIDDVIDYMTNDQPEGEKNGGTADDSFGGDASYGTDAILDFTKIKNIGSTPKSASRSVDDNGKPIAGTQYALYLEYCTDARTTKAGEQTWAGTGETGSEAYWGTTTKEIEKDSNRDQDWYTGKQCTDPIKSKMMQMFRQYTNYCLQIATMDGTDNCWGAVAASSVTTSDSIATGECTSLAQQLLDSPNIAFQGNARQYMEQTAKDCTQQTACGTTQMSDKLLGLMVSASQKYKITIGAQAAGHNCDHGYHPQGQAFDINGVRRLDQEQQMKIQDSGTAPYSTQDAAIIKEFDEYLDRTAAQSGMSLEIGQQQCFGAGMIPNVRAGTMVNDTCHHVHVGVR